MAYFPLVQHSTVIARLRCLGVHTSSEDGQLWTDTAFAVALRVKGYLPHYIVVRRRFAAAKKFFRSCEAGREAVFTLSA